ncbi:hypothetical protein HMPREF3212_03265 [Citrobacter freundii]|nr:hypothetical protein AB07_0684 [Citrobacter freundii]KWZ89395.1 hypothetical protein HMPREF3212_03265 [Citrobacter freundii]
MNNEYRKVKTIITLYNVIPCWRNKIICVDCKMIPPASLRCFPRLFPFDKKRKE